MRAQFSVIYCHAALVVCRAMIRCFAVVADFVIRCSDFRLSPASRAHATVMLKSERYAAAFVDAARVTLLPARWRARALILLMQGDGERASRDTCARYVLTRERARVRGVRDDARDMLRHDDVDAAFAAIRQACQ